jgi:hypothetical protein
VSPVDTIIAIPIHRASLQCQFFFSLLLFILQRKDKDKRKKKKKRNGREMNWADRLAAGRSSLSLICFRRRRQGHPCRQMSEYDSVLSNRHMHLALASDKEEEEKKIQRSSSFVRLLSLSSPPLCLQLSPLQRTLNRM